jgi:transcriptional regulator with XRE-family HTH domain
MLVDNAAVSFNHHFLRERRLALKLTQAQCAKEAGFPNLQKWSNYENGRIPDPQLSTLEAIARTLKCSVQDLIK